MGVINQRSTPTGKTATVENRTIDAIVEDIKELNEVVKTTENDLKNAMTTVVCGNSIAAQQKVSASDIAKGLHLANILSGSPMQFKEITASTRCDQYGIYGYSGATLETILSDINDQWFTPIANAGVIPDLVYGYALLENDIFQGRTLLQMQQSLNAWIQEVKNRWKGCIIILNTPHPSFGYTTAGMRQNYIDISNYILSLDNGIDLFSCQINDYESPTVIGNPIANEITASISGTTMTVTATDTVIEKNSYIFSGAYAAIVTAFGTGSGGVGTYTVSVSANLTTQNFTLSHYTDNGPHPNAKGSLVNARRHKETFERIGSVWKNNYQGYSNNMSVYGSTAAQSPAVGTMATGMQTNILDAGSTYVTEALLPGYQEQITTPASSGPSYPGVNWVSMGAIAVTGVTTFSPFVIIELISGAENLKFIQLSARVQDSGGNTFRYYLSSTTNSTEPDWQNGDKLTFIYPPIKANSGSISQLTNYIRKTLKLRGGTFTYKIISQGYYKIN